MKTKKIYFNALLIAFFLVASSAFAQSSLWGQPAQANPTIIQPAPNQTLAVPNTMNYQAVARDAGGNILASTTVGLRLTIEDGSGGSTLYQERQTPTTNQFGLLTVKLGSGTILVGTWAGIVWSNGNQWLKVDLDPTGGSSYTPMGESELLSVPFANFAAATAAVSGTTNNISKFTSPNTIGNARITDDGFYMNFGTATNWLAYNLDGGQYCNMRVHNTVGGLGEAYFVSDRLTSGDNGGLAISVAQAVKWAVGSFATDNLTISNWNLSADALTISNANNSVGIGAAPVAYSKVNAEAGASSVGLTGRSTTNTTGTAVTATFGGLGTELIGLYGRVEAGGSASFSYGAAGENLTTSGYPIGVLGLCVNAASSTHGLYGYAAGSAGSNIGMYGDAEGPDNNYGIITYVTATTTAYAGYFQGNVYATGTITSSDAKLKKDIQPINDGLNMVMALKPSTYFYKSDGEAQYMNLPKQKQFGLIAQDVETVMPSIVSENVQPERINIKGTGEKAPAIHFKGLNYTQLIPVLISAIQEQQAQIEDLKAQINQSKK